MKGGEGMTMSLWDEGGYDVVVCGWIWDEAGGHGPAACGRALGPVRSGTGPASGA